MTDEQIKEKAAAVIARTEKMVFCTLHVTGAPDARAMLNLRGPTRFAALEEHLPKNPFHTYLITDFNSEKTSQVRLNPKACLYYWNEKTGESVTVIGRAKLADDPDTKRELWREAWKEYFPDGIASPHYTPLAFTGELIKYYDGKYTVWRREIV